MQDIKNFTLEELKSIFTAVSLPRFCAGQVFNWVYRKRAEDFDTFTDISKPARKYLKENFYFSKLETIQKQTSCDGTIKYLFALCDGYAIESVFIPEVERATLCLSTQVGCKYSCKFCASGAAGFKRNLTAGEIVNQYLAVSLDAKITNIVFMGIGEPLDNFDNVVKALEIFMDKEGLYFGKSRLCVSTAGVIPGIEKLAGLNLGIKLAISLHSADNGKRSLIMPINKIYPVNKLINVARQFSRLQKHALFFEYILIKGFNCFKEDAVALAELAGGLKCKINLIPSNQYTRQPGILVGEEIEDFKEELKNRGVFFTVRKPRGADIQAACGQLRLAFERQNKKVF